MFSNIFQRCSKEHNSLFSILTVGLLLLPCISAATFSGKDSLFGLTFFFNSATIDADSLLLIKSGIYHYFYSTFTNHSELCLYETLLVDPGMTIGFTGDVYNYGVMVFDDTNTISVMDFSITGSNFINTGDLYVKGIKTILGSSGHKITSSNFDNLGVLNFDQSSGQVTVTLGSGTMTNTGTICLQNLNYKQATTIVGTGYISVNSNGQLTITKFSDYTFGRPNNIFEQIFLQTFNPRVQLYIF